MTLPKTTNALLSSIVDPYGVYCVLELRMDEQNSIFQLFPVMPESLVVVQRYLQTITPTQGGVFVDDFGRAPSPVILSGTFGRSPRMDIVTGQEALLAAKDQVKATNAVSTLSSVNFNNKDAPVTGYTLVKQVSEMVNLSHVPDPTTGNLPKAYFYNFAFGQFYEVALTGFQAQMDVDRNGLWYYELQLIMLRRINDGPIDSIPGLKLAAGPADILARSKALVEQRLAELAKAPAADVLRRRGPLLSVKSRLRLQNALDTVQKVRRAIPRVNALVSSFRAGDYLTIGAGLLDRALGLRPGSLISLYDTAKQLPQIRREIENIAFQTKQSIPQEWAREIESAKEAIRTILPAAEQQVSLLSAAQAGLSAQPASEEVLSVYTPETADLMLLTETLLTLQEELDGIDTFIELYGLSAAPSDASSTVFSSSPIESSGPGTENYTIRQGDTLLGIAQRTYGDENAWTMIAPLLPDSFKNVASTELLNSLVGTVIQLPTISNSTDALIPYVWNSPKGVQALGRDLPDTLTTRTREDGTKELVILSEEETLLQGLVHRLQTPLGSIPDDQFFGSTIPAMIGQEFGALNTPMNEVKVADALRQEPRLLSVDKVQVNQSRDTLAINFAATARNAGSLGNISLSISRQSP